MNLVVTSIFVIIFQWSIVGVLLASIIIHLIQVGLLFRHLRPFGATLRPRWNQQVVRDTFTFGIRGYVGNIFQFYNYRLDVFIVNAYLGPSSVGLYGVATRMAELVWNFPNAVSFVIFPKAASSNKKQMNQFTPRVFFATLAVTIAASLLLVLTGKFFISLIYSEEFVGAYLPMITLLPGIALLGAGRVLTNDIAGRGHPEYNSINSAISLVVTILLDILLIPRWGILGASLASSISYGVTFATAVIFYLRVSRQSELSVNAAQSH